MTAVKLGPPVPVAWDEDDLIVWARLYDARWNGWACPAFDRENTQKIIDFNAAGDHSGFSQFAWDGDTLIETFDEVDPTCGPERIDPVIDDAGVMRWTVGAWSWVWYEVPQPACRKCGWSQVGRSDRETCPTCDELLDWC